MQALLVDIGNTRLKSALWCDGGLREPRAQAWRERAAADELASMFSEMWAGSHPQRVVCCNVAGAKMADALGTWCEQHWRLQIEYIGSAASFDDLRCAYAQPEKLGDDRWLALIGARALYGEPLCVVDCGTATTVDLLARGGRHMGGAILPGIGTMRAALARNTHALTAATGTPQAFSADTEPAIAGGTAYALAGAVERLFDEACEALGEMPRCVLCGGEADMLTSLLRLDVIQHPQLVLAGLAVAARLS